MDRVGWPAFAGSSRFTLAEETDVYPGMVDNDFVWPHLGGHMQATILVFLELMVLSAVGLTAIWGSLGRPHWFLRVAVVLGILSLWLVVPAYEPLLVFFTQSAVTIVPLAWARRRRARLRAGAAASERDSSATTPRRPQFSLADLLLLTVVAAVVFAAAAQVPSNVWENWLRFVLYGAGYGLITLAAAWIALGRCRWWLRAIGLCVALPSVLMVGWIILARRSGLCGGRPPARATLRHLVRIAAAALSLLILLPPAFVYHALVTPAPIPAAEMPSPNGYDDLMRAGKALGSVSAPAKADGADVLRIFVRRHARALQNARIGLDRSSRVPIRYDSPDFPLENIQRARALARAFLGEGYLAEAEGRTEDAVRSHFDIVRLGNAIAPGGLSTDRLVGLAVKNFGIGGLSDMSDGLSPQQCRELIEMLRMSDAGWEPLEDCLVRDRAWEDRAFGWQGRFVVMSDSVAGSVEWKRESVQTADRRYEAWKKLLICKLAIRCYRLEHGNLPGELADLVPECLPEVPGDPFSGKPLVYRRQGKDYVLYSVGPDQRDDDGHRADPKNQFEEDKDLFLDALTEYQ